MTTYRTLEEAARAYGATRNVKGKQGGWLYQLVNGREMPLRIQGWNEYGQRLVQAGIIQPQDAEGRRLDRTKTAQGTQTHPYRMWRVIAKQFVITEHEVKTPAAVVVDTKDGTVFERGSKGELFTAETAKAFAERANAALKPNFRTFKVYRLVPVED